MALLQGAWHPNVRREGPRVRLSLRMHVRGSACDELAHPQCAEDGVQVDLFGREGI